MPAGMTWAELSKAKLSALAQQLTKCELQVPAAVQIPSLIFSVARLGARWVVGTVELFGRS